MWNAFDFSRPLIPQKLLGQGGFSAAFLACDRRKLALRDRYSPNRYCVVKQFKPSGNLSSQELDLAQELFTMEELGNKHSQIPNLFAFFTPLVTRQDGTNQEQFFYLVQEYIEGQDL